MLLLVAMPGLTAAEALAENLTRGITAIHKPSGGNFISWRQLPTDPKECSYQLMADGITVASDLTVSCYTHTSGTANTKYKVVTKNANGNTLDTSIEAQTWSNVYKTMKMERPTGGSFSYRKGQLGSNKPSTDSIGHYTYYIQEASVADADNDGEWEIVVKWNNTAAQDNAIDGFTGSCILDGYHLNPAIGNETAPERLWRINLGPNIRTGSHYTQFLFYDFNGDGRAELICKTAPGSVDGTGRFVSEAADDEAIRTTDNTMDYRNDKGRIMSGPEFLTVFDGMTGRAIHTIWYNPNRAFTTGRASSYSEQWGDSYGNRGERFLACAAHLDGQDKPASAIMCRGYYTRSYLWAVDFDGQKLSTKWLHASVSKTRVEVTDANGQKTVRTYNSNISGKGDNYTAYGQGCHSIAAGDVDGDGCDEIIYGAAAIGHDGHLLYSTGLGHGDAHHLGKFFPDREGLQFMMPHEDANNGWHVRDAATGELLVWKASEGDNGRGMAADIDSDHRGAEFWSAADYNVYNINGEIVSQNKRPTYCFRIYWDGTLQDNLLDGGKIDAYNNGNGARIFQNPISCIKNGSKAYPVLSADLFGDWREEVIWCSAADSSSLVICSTTTETKYTVPTLMSDHLYRLSIVWQNVAYNQPPHLSYYLPDMFATRFEPIGNSKKEQTIILGQAIEPIVCQLRNCTSATVIATLLDGIKVKTLGVPAGFNFLIDRQTKQFTLTATPEQTGTYEVVIRSSGDLTGTKLEDTLRITVSSSDGISDIPYQTSSADYTQDRPIHDLQGRRISNPIKGIYIRNGKKYIK